METEARVISHTMSKRDNKPYTILRKLSPNNFNQNIFLEGHQFTVGKKVKITIAAIV